MAMSAKTLATTQAIFKAFHLKNLQFFKPTGNMSDVEYNQEPAHLIFDVYFCFVNLLMP